MRPIRLWKSREHCKMHGKEEKLQAFGRLLDIMDEVRARCPWDKKQTFETLRPQTVEEVYELSTAILDASRAETCKELGDVLLHIVFYSKLGEEEGSFDLADVCNAISDKLVYRHPHIFGDVSVSSDEDVKRNWEMLKLKEKDGNKTVLGGVGGLPTLLKAFRMQDKVHSVGFDWKCKEDVWDKVFEEIGEFREQMRAADEAGDDKYTRGKVFLRAEEECGDFLFSVVNAARLYGINPDDALERTCNKFRRRFEYIESRTAASGRSLKDMSLEEMDSLWNEAKKQETNINDK